MEQSLHHNKIPPSCEEIEIFFSTHDIPKGKEIVLVERVEPQYYLLSCSPGWVPGLSAGDTIALDPSSNLGYKMVKRGGNLAVQIYFPATMYRDILDHILSLAKKENLSLINDGYMEGSNVSLLVFTNVKPINFSKVEDIFNATAKEFIETKWFYGNVYDPSDGKTPLNWWVS